MEIDAPKSNLSTFEKIELAVKEEIKDAKDHISTDESDKRIARWDRYYGRPLGNEQTGRSRYISRDIMETIEWIMPDLLSTFLAEDSKISINVVGQPPIVGRALMQKIQDDLNEDDERSMFLLFYTWFKDSMVSDTAFVGPSWYTEENVESIQIPEMTYPQMMKLQETPGVELVAFTDNYNGIYTDVEFEKTTIVEDRLRVDNIPHWDFLVEKNAKFINDEYGKGYKSEVTLDYLYSINDQYRSKEGEEFFQNLDKLRLYLYNKKERGDDSEKSSYYNYMDDDELRMALDDLGDKLPSLKTVVDVAQWYTTLDINGDGRLENVVCWIANREVLLRYEENPYDSVMISSISPIIDCYKMFGIAFSEMLIDIQNLKTMITRRILDNFDFSTLGRVFVKPGGDVPIKELLQGIPGDVNLIDPSRIQIEYPKQFDSRVLEFINYIDQVKENRSGSTRANQGTDPESVNKNVGGVAMMQAAAKKRIDMVGRLFAETGIRDLYKKCVILYQKNISKPFTVKVDGQDVTVSPQQIQGKIHCKANLGIELQLGMAEAQRIEQIFAFLGQVNQMYPGLLEPQHIHKLAVGYVTNLGKKQPEDYVSDIKKFIQNLQKAQQMSTQMREREWKLKEEELRINWAKVQVAAEKNKVDLTEIMKNFEGRMSTKAMDVQRGQESDQLNFLTDLLKLKYEDKHATQQLRKQNSKQ